MRRLAIVAAALACTSAAAQEPERRCMEHHLREAIALNRERMPLYAAETGGRSLPVSRRLIGSERLALLAAWTIDRRARPWLERGVRIVCDEFVPMDHAPAFLPRSVERPPPLPAFQPPEVRAIRRRALLAYRAGGFPAASAVLERGLDALAGHSRVYVRSLTNFALGAVAGVPSPDGLRAGRLIPSPGAAPTVTPPRTPPSSPQPPRAPPRRARAGAAWSRGPSGPPRTRARRGSWCR
jgi:hypothetical protein